jgi:hypothetical protein
MTKGVQQQTAGTPPDQRKIRLAWAASALAYNRAMGFKPFRIIITVTLMTLSQWQSRSMCPANSYLVCPPPA